MFMTTTFLPDHAVDSACDVELRALLSTCFTGPQDHVFRTQRFFHRMPQWRWMQRDEQGITVHVAAHDLIATHSDGEIRFAGIAEVCVRPDCRGRGLVRALLVDVHRDLVHQGMDWAALLGKPEVYGSSGYRPTGQPLRYLKQGAVVEEVIAAFQVARLTPAANWPKGVLDLGGPCLLYTSPSPRDH
jgi:predicted N-acetyltransferase YhbS